MDKKFLIVANWKASTKFTIYNLQLTDATEVAIAAPYPFIPKIPEGFSKAAQDVSSLQEGAYTGEVPAQLLANLEVKYCLVGHSERRKNFGETNEQVQQKINQLLENDIVPIVCAQNFEEIPSEVHGCFIMYEPSAAISTNGQYHPETPENISKTLVDWQRKLPENVEFLYGGSVNPKNCKLIIENCKLVSGFVVGHASLDPQTFGEIIDSVTKVL